MNLRIADAYLACLICAALLLAAQTPVICAADGTGEIKVEFKLTSPSFGHGAAIPVKHTGDGPDSSPALEWSGAPDGVKAFVLICDDPDAPVGTWVHWVICDIPPALNRIEEAVPKENVVLKTAGQGRNDFGKIGYRGPSPPRGKPHRYFFRLYAVDKETGLPPGATGRQALDAIKGHILAQTELMGTYQRR